MTSPHDKPKMHCAAVFEAVRQLIGTAEKSKDKVFWEKISCKQFDIQQPTSSWARLSVMTPCHLIFKPLHHLHHKHPFFIQFHLTKNYSHSTNNHQHQCIILLLSTSSLSSQFSQKSCNNSKNIQHHYTHGMVTFHLLAPEPKSARGNSRQCSIKWKFLCSAKVIQQRVGS